LTEQPITETAFFNEKRDVPPMSRSLSHNDLSGAF